MTIKLIGPSIFGFENPLSISPVQQTRSVEFNENFIGRNPQTNLMQPVLCRAINAAVDLSAPEIDRFVRYKTPWNEELILYVHAGGLTPINMLGILEVGDAINQATLQWGV
jgi:hypothetical protein